MSLIQQKQYRVGVIASKSFDHSDFLNETFGAHLEEIACLYTNGVNPMVMEFARVNGLTFTVFPPNRSNSILWSNSRIIENSDKVFVLAAPGSKNTKIAVEQCEKAKVKYEVVEYEQLEHWKGKVLDIQQVVEAVSQKEIEESPTLKSVMLALKGVL